MKTTLELTVSSELHANNLIEKEAHQVKGLRHGIALVSNFSHGGWGTIAGCVVLQGVKAIRTVVGEVQ